MVFELLISYYYNQKHTSPFVDRKYKYSHEMFCRELLLIYEELSLICNRNEKKINKI